MNVDRKLDRILKEWRCDCGADPWIEDRVWLRINRMEVEEAKPSFWERFDLLRVPALACGLIVIGIAAGIGAGEWQTRAAADPAAEERLADVYLQSINPIALAASHRNHGEAGR